MSDEIEYTGETVTTVATIAAPWSRQITLQTVAHESGLRTMRMRIKEGRARFTIIDLDPPTAKALVDILAPWAEGG
ncbi:MAG: hypothetical protein HY985_08775 [Magnetospirillum sp.]|nr:hypothetical protein [Magnetospirillum sp.]